MPCTISLLTRFSSRPGVYKAWSAWKKLVRFSWDLRNSQRRRDNCSFRFSHPVFIDIAVISHENIKCMACGTQPEGPESPYTGLCKDENDAGNVTTCEHEFQSCMTSVISKYSISAQWSKSIVRGWQNYFQRVLVNQIAFLHIHMVKEFCTQFAYVCPQFSIL